MDKAARRVGSSGMMLTKKLGLAAICALAGSLVVAGWAFVQSPARAEDQTAAQSSETVTPEPERQTWSFAGPFGTFDRAQLQRGYHVYREVCSNCHSMKFVAFRNLSDPGGPEFSTEQVKALAASFQIDELNDAGEPSKRPGRPSDFFPWIFPNAKAAVATYGALPPDMSLLAKARSYERGFPRFIGDIFTQYQEQGPDYIVSLMTGYSDPPKGTTLSAGQSYNPYFPARKIRMPPPLTDGRVEYTDGTPQTVKQYALDVAAFLQWAAEPKLEERKMVGFRVLVFLIVFAGLLYFVKKKIWADLH
jgi:cytochrome c1